MVAVSIPARSLHERSLLLYTFPNFGGMSLENIQHIAEQTLFRRFKAGQEIPLTKGGGRKVDEQLIYFITSGAAELYVDSVGVISEISAPGGIGFLAVFNSKAGECSARALTEIDALEIDATSFRNLLEEHFSILRNSMAGAARAVINLSGGLPAGSGMPSPERLKELESPDTLFSRIRCLSGSIFDNGSLDASFDVARQLRRVKYAPGEVVFRENEPSTWWIVILKGQLECSKGNDSVTVYPDYTVGVLDAIAGLPRGYSVTAQTDVEAYRLDIDALINVLEDHSELALAALTLTSSTIWDLSLARASKRKAEKAA